MEDNTEMVSFFFPQFYYALIKHFTKFQLNPLPGFDKQYDSALTRLIVRPWDDWKGISPNAIAGVDDFTPEPPIFAAKFSLVENYSHILAIANEDGKVS
jgi:hypothetical protein